MAITKYAFDAQLHREGTVGRRGGCSWHGVNDFAEHPTSSYRTPNGMMAACPRAERQIEDLYGQPTRRHQGHLRSSPTSRPPAPGAPGA
ncbi:hypothetical protein AB0885_39815, partial [Streptomyces sp. NPDC005534]|uniref:hypothetical protein n=1 Tax=Streptomyces sp. NPDC005534 TaxID=3155714 RepID=UPI0034562E58